LIDPFTIQDAETLIAAIHRDWGEAQGNYDEFRFFTGLRPSEQIALVVNDFNPVEGMLTVNKARVAGVDKDSTKTGDDRRIRLCPRALTVLHQQLRFARDFSKQVKSIIRTYSSRQAARQSATCSIRTPAGDTR
jgi:integrase